MPKDYSRTERVASSIQRCLSQLIRKIKDPRLDGIITINEVIVSKDLSIAKVYVSVLPADKEHDAVIEVLNNAKGFLHNLLGRELSMRIVPRLQFFHDTLLADANRLEKLIDQVIEDDSKGED